ncbi:hypothetical protein [Thaumasiovibrio subtropicus]|uniref:hypothetical protein n=1 Tax=Thaumasiovibrio subtropicus TaxID=1891207 RepID=UPI000B34C0AD|nr:hypothetical protein [Thaumasiovibrio subtropicus]
MTKQQSIALFSQQPQAQLTAQVVTQDLSHYSLTEHNGGFADAVKWLQRNPAADVMMIEVVGKDLDALDKLAALIPPHSKVILIGHAISVEAYRRLIQLGVGDYLSFPVDPVALRRTLDHLEGRVTESSFHQGALTLVTGTSGGVGVSSVAANLAYGIADHHSVALVDLNLAHSQHPILLGVDYKPTLAQLAVESERIDAVLIQQFGHKVNDKLQAFYGEGQEETSLGALLVTIQQLRRQFSHVIVDLPPHLHMAMRELIETADTVLMVHDFSLQAGRRLQKFMTLEAQGSQQRWTVGNVSRASGHKRWTSAQLHSGVELREVSTLPFDGKAFAKSELQAKPVIALSGGLTKEMKRLTTLISGGR